MANELTISASLRVNKGDGVGVQDELKKNGQLADMAGNVIEAGVQHIGYLTHEQVVINSDIGTPGWAMFANLDASSTIEIGLEVGTTFYPFMEIPPERTGGPIKLATEPIYARATASTAYLQKLIIEE